MKICILILSAVVLAAQPTPRTANGKPDLSGVWQPGSDKPGTGERPIKELVCQTGAEAGAEGGASFLSGLGGGEGFDYFNKRAFDNPVARCIPQLDLGGNEGSLYPWQFVQTPDLIVILVESRHVFRLVLLNAKHPEDLDPSYLGDAVGRWDGDTLVVDVTGFKEIMTGLNIHTDAMHVVERFTRVDYNAVNFEATVEDPKALTKPWKVTSKLMLRPGTRLQEYVCEENNQDPAQMERLVKEGVTTRK